ncbi:MAG: DUF1772 domain-containing protein [Actinomycetota bacterium]
MNEVKNLRAMEALGLAGCVGFVASMFTIGMGLGRSWTQLEPQVFAETFPGTFLFLLPTVGLTLTPGVYGVWQAYRAAAPGSAAFRRWRLALAGLLASTTVTLIYHVPANYRIWQHDLTDAQISTELDRWLVFHAIRLVIAVAAMLAAFRAIASSTRISDSRPNETLSATRA